MRFLNIFVALLVVAMAVEYGRANMQEPTTIATAPTSSEETKEVATVGQGQSVMVPLPTELTVKLVQDPPKVITRTVRVPADPAKPVENKGISAPLWVWIVLCSAVLVALLCCAYLLGRQQRQPVGYPPIVVQMGAGVPQPVAVQGAGQPQPPPQPPR